MKFKLAMVCTSVAFLLYGCGGQDNAGTAKLSGQVGALSAPATSSHYAAARFLEQASMVDCFANEDDAYQNYHARKYG